MLSNSLGLIFGLSFGIWILSFVINGVRTGSIHHTDSTSTYSFKKEPVKFILVTSFFIILGSMFLYFSALRAIAIWKIVSV
jgi:hypothetical protein